MVLVVHIVRSGGPGDLPDINKSSIWSWCSQILWSLVMNMHKFDEVPQYCTSLYEFMLVSNTFIALQTSCHNFFNIVWVAGRFIITLNDVVWCSIISNSGIWCSTRLNNLQLCSVVCNSFVWQCTICYDDERCSTMISNLTQCPLILNAVLSFSEILDHGSMMLNNCNFDLYSTVFTNFQWFQSAWKRF